MAYTIYVHSQLEYASMVWCPHTAQNIDSKPIEAVQRRAARSVMNDWSRPNSKHSVCPSNSTQDSPTIMLQQLGWNTIEERRIHSRAIMMYRIVNELIAIPGSSYLIPNTPSTRGHSHIVINSKFHPSPVMHLSTASFQQLSEYGPVCLLMSSCVLPLRPPSLD